VVAFTTSCIVMFVLIAVGLSYRKRRPVGTPLTWGESMVAATYVFFLLFWAYGVVPHFWLAWADGDLNMAPNRIWMAPRYKTTPSSFKWPLPITVSYQALRDIVAVGIYGVLLGANVAVWPFWQNRGKKKPVELVKSDYGRPLVREGGAN
jgi:hypothetical protein